MVLKLRHAFESPGRFVKIHIPGFSLKVSDSVNLGWGLRSYISNKFPGDVIVDLVPHFENH